MSDDGGTEATREPRPDETSEQKSDREVTENHVQGVEQAVFRGQLSRKQADRVIKAGQKAHQSHDVSRGLGRQWRGDHEILGRG